MVAKSDQAIDDCSNNFQKLKSKLSTEELREYRILLKSFKPNYKLVYRDILIAYLGVFVSLALGVQLQYSDLNWMSKIFITIMLSSFIGFFFSNLELFGHEAAHFNISSSKRLNDLMANWLIMIWVAQDISAYRIIHFAHHRNLGQIDDTENSYFNELNLNFLIKLAFGIHVFYILRTREGISRTIKKRSVVFYSVLLHSLVLIIFIVNQWLLLVPIWIFGWGSFFPFFAALRQLLEHRNPLLAKTHDCKFLPHGAFTRNFKCGVFSWFFGGAGFRQHLFHHWEPQISYTNYSELKKFYSKTLFAPIIKNRETTYWYAFKQNLKLGY